MMSIKETLSTPLRGKYDVIVVGGGIGGICAAVSAKRNGAKRVLLLEKSVQLGGLATIGLISWYEPLCDGDGRKIMYGIADELMQLATRYGPDSLCNEWSDNPDKVETKARFSTHFSPAMFAMGLDKFLIDDGVDILFDTLAVKPVMEENRCAGIVVENKTGRGFYKAKVVVDGTGDADILSRAGVPCVCGKNYLTYIAYNSDMDTLKKAVDKNNMMNMRTWLNAGSDLWGNGHPKNKPMLSGVIAEEVTQFVLDGRSMLFEMIKDEDSYTRDITVLPNMAQFRTTRRIVGNYTLTEKDEGKYFDDSIGIVGDFANRGKIYEMPYRLLYNSKYNNLLTVGRSISSSGWAWDVTRVIPGAAATGQAAGTAAAVCAKKGIALKEVDIKDLQKRLTETKVNLHIKK